MKKIYPILTLALSAALLSTALAQKVTPIRGRIPLPTAPVPFSYPAGFLQPTFDRNDHIGEIVKFGDQEVVLGKTKLSEVTSTLGGSLEFDEYQTEFLCYSAEAPKATDKTEPSNYQNIWLILGPKGEISEARILRVENTDKKCPALEEKFKPVKVGPLYINESVKDLGKIKGTEPSEISKESEWTFWFSEKPSGEKTSQIGLLGTQESNGLITKIISVIDTYVEPEQQ